MNWNKVITTFDDGSELRRIDLAESFAFGIVLSGAIIGGLILYENLRDRRWNKAFEKEYKEALERLNSQ